VIAFKVSLNGKHVCTAGVGEFGVVSAIVTWVRRRPEKSRDGKSIEEELTADIGGLDSDANEHLKWLARRLRVGDRITLEVINADRVHKPKRRYRDDPKMVERAKKRYFERLKKEFEENATQRASNEIRIRTARLRRRRPEAG
jgi:hypothetical protein